MGNFFGKIVITALAALIASYLIAGVHFSSGLSAIVFAVVLALLNNFVKPILIILTIPITILTLGLFLLVINILIIKWSANIVPGFTVANWWAALWFSIVLSIVTALINALIGPDKNQERK